MNGWISINDSLPENRLMVLVYEPSFAKSDALEKKRGYGNRPFGVRLGSYIEPLGYMRPEGCNGIYNVTHWQYLPEPPKEQS